MTRLRADGTREERERGAEGAPGRGKEQGGESGGTLDLEAFYLSAVRKYVKDNYFCCQAGGRVVMQVQCRPEAIYGLFLLKRSCCADSRTLAEHLFLSSCRPVQATCLYCTLTMLVCYILNIRQSYHIFCQQSRHPKKYRKA
jgi:hypothetical protein